MVILDRIALIGMLLGVSFIIQPWWSEGLRVAADALHRESEAAVQKLEERYLAQLRNQSRWSGLAARLSPLTSFDLAAYDLAADGIEQERRFVAALQDYGQVWAAYAREQERDLRFLDKKSRRGGGEMVAGAVERSRRGLDLGDYPRFEFEYMSLGDRLELIWPDVLLLSLWTALFFMASYISFLRYNIH